MKLERLLVVIDAEHDRQPALQRAAELAGRTGAKLHLLQVEYHPSLEGGLLDSHLLARARDAMREERHAELSARVADLREAGLDIEVEVRWGKRRHEEVLARIAVLQPDVVFKSTHPSSALRRLLLSDTGWQLIRRCPVPLWLVHEGPWRGQRLCAALDPLHSADKPAALDHQLIGVSLELQRQLGLQPHYLHSLAPLPRSLLFDAEVAQEYDDYVAQCAREHRDAFDKLIAQYPIAPAQTHLLEGFAEEVIPRFVQEQAIDLLLMGAIARGHLDSLLIGHTAERVLERIECDLLVIKPNGKG
ncbi:universal stress protein [Ectopseudomonas hydrolytica]|jgi:universal stress protein E|uniref:universal stress protein n=1 Tax=Ectopseudomonas hydrolytica TaxID=2493633 RepID=UPI0018A7C384|nr:universal stress protein [Pseudomonas hydrolytica]MBF8161868.1 universal stress protein [Pseudomonas mendocina]UTH30522.1 universal stress protein [Pseudomonas hydrolytica]UZZ09676.1 universal stress protein [Pseudomonas mendocina]